MAGLGRRTHYRKHLTDSVLNDLPEPSPPLSLIAKIVATRGSNQFDVRLAGSNGQEELAILPTKFRKLVWLKRNDYVIVDTAAETNDEKGEATQTNDSGGIRCMISHILYHEQIKHLVGKGLWPMNDPEFAVDDRKMNDATQPQADEDGIVFNDAYAPRDEDDAHEIASDEEPMAADDPLLFVNTNRLARLAVQDSSSDEEDKDEN
eukprot:scaffold425_cov175-Amphora_coffeaeformis.AAC.74